MFRFSSMVNTVRREIEEDYYRGILLDAGALVDKYPDVTRRWVSKCITQCIDVDPKCWGRSLPKANTEIIAARCPRNEAWLLSHTDGPVHSRKDRLSVMEQVGVVNPLSTRAKILRFLAQSNEPIPTQVIQEKVGRQRPLKMTQELGRMMNRLNASGLKWVSAREGKECLHEVCLIPVPELANKMIEELHEFWTSAVYSITGIVELTEAEEIVQQVLLRMKELYVEGKEFYAPKAYFFTAVRNKALNLKRNKRRRREASLRPDFAETLSSNTDIPHSFHLLYAALDTLPKGQKEVLLLRYKMGFSYEEIAAHLGLKIGTVSSRINRGMSRLRMSLVDPS